MVGRHLCDHLRRRGWAVRALMRDVNAYPFTEGGIERRGMDLPDVLHDDSLAGVEIVVHAAYATRARDPEAARRVNEDGTLRVLAAARDGGVRRFVFVSSLSAHADARSRYGRGKLAMEAHMDPARDLVLRPGLVLARDGGLAHRLWHAIARARIVPVVGGGRQIVQTIHIDDLCDAFARALDLDLTGCIHVAEPDGLAMQEFLALLARTAGVRPLMLPLPATPALWLLRALEAARLPLPVSSENLLGLMTMRHVETRADLERLQIRVRDARESLADLAPVRGRSGAR